MAFVFLYVVKFVFLLKYSINHTCVSINHSVVYINHTVVYVNTSYIYRFVDGENIFIRV